MAWQAVIVTGASKGFGKAVAISYAKLVKSPLHFVLSGYVVILVFVFD
jgi:NADP-dependent 3-hydroxy acid dehydrogenase YdfG